MQRKLTTRITLFTQTQAPLATCCGQQLGQPHQLANWTQESANFGAGKLYYHH